MNKEQKRELEKAKELFKNIVTGLFFALFTILVIAVIF